LILPCPDELPELRTAIEWNDIVVLMKIGKRLPAVLALLEEMGIAANCAFARHVGMDDEVIHSGVHNMDPEKSLGYLATMLIRSPRKTSRRAHLGAYLLEPVGAADLITFRRADSGASADGAPRRVAGEPRNADALPRRCGDYRYRQTQPR
jgi:hypothetical protein